MKVNNNLLENPTHWHGSLVDGTLFSGTGKTSVLSFYGMIDKYPTTHTVRVLGTLRLRRNDNDLSNYYAGFPLINLLTYVGLTTNNIPQYSVYRELGTAVYGINTTLNGEGGRVYQVENSKNLGLGRLYDLSSGKVGAWAWDTIGYQAVQVDFTVIYTE